MTTFVYDTRAHCNTEMKHAATSLQWSICGCHSIIHEAFLTTQASPVYNLLTTGSWILEHNTIFYFTHNSFKTLALFLSTRPANLIWTFDSQLYATMPHSISPCHSTVFLVWHNFFLTSTYIQNIVPVLYHVIRWSFLFRYR